MYIYLYVGSVYSISIFSEKVNKLKIKSPEVSAEKMCRPDGNIFRSADDKPTTAYRVYVEEA